MRQLLLLLLITLSSSVAVYAQTAPQMDFEAYDPPSSLVVPEHPMRRAKFPFLDVHSHHWRMDEMNLDQLIAEMDAMNMQWIVNLSGGGGLRLKGIMDNIKKYGYEDRIIVLPILTLVASVIPTGLVAPSNNLSMMSRMAHAA